MYEPSPAAARRLDTRAAQEAVRLGLMNMLLPGVDEKGNRIGVPPEEIRIDKTTITYTYRSGKNQTQSGTVTLADIDPRVTYTDHDLRVGPGWLYGGSKDTVDMYPRRGGGWTISRAVNERKEGEPTFRDLADALLALKFRSSLYADPAFEEQFQQALRTYRTAAVKPELPESARRFRVQAEAMVREKNFNKAIELYEELLRTAPWWPEGHFNLAVQLSEAKDFAGAIVEMKRYLMLVPGAPDARDAQDRIYEWELKVPAKPDTPPAAPARRGAA